MKPVCRNVKPIYQMLAMSSIYPVWLWVLLLTISTVADAALGLVFALDNSGRR